MANVHIHLVCHAEGELHRRGLVHLCAHHAPVLVVDGEAVLGAPLRNLSRGKWDRISFLWENHQKTRVHLIKNCFFHQWITSGLHYISLSENLNHLCLCTESFLLKSLRVSRDWESLTSSRWKKNADKNKSKIKKKIFNLSWVSEKTHVFTDCYFLPGYKRAPSKIWLLVTLYVN